MSVNDLQLSYSFASKSFKDFNKDGSMWIVVFLSSGEAGVGAPVLSAPILAQEAPHAHL